MIEHCITASHDNVYCHVVDTHGDSQNKREEFKELQPAIRFTNYVQSTSVMAVGTSIKLQIAFSDPMNRVYIH